MGKKDIITKAYLQDNEVFADVFNYQLFDGEPVIQSRDLKELDPTELIILPDKSPDAAIVEQGKQRRQKQNRSNELIKGQFRDILRNTIIRSGGNAVYQLRLGTELQTAIHYAMPVRNQLYDAAEYYKQIEQTIRRHKREHDYKGHSSDEFTSWFYKEDDLIPVFTLTIYFGSDPWDGPKSLHEMMHSADPEILKHIPDYRIHLIEPARLTECDLLKFQSSFREVMGYIKYSKDAAALKKYIKDNPRMNMDVSAARVIEAMTKTKIPYAEVKEDKIDMCKAIEDMLAQAKAEGEVTGENKGKFQALSELVQDNILTAADAAKRAGMTLEEFSALCNRHV